MIAGMTQERQLISSGSKFEDIVGYSRAVRCGTWVGVSGTTAAECGDVVGQTRAVLLRIEQALREAGASRADVVRTRIFLTDIADWEAVGAVHGEFFAAVRPATTVLQVDALVAPELLVEIEADAIVGVRPGGTAQ